MEKAQLRAQVRQVLKALTEDRVQALSQKICRRVRKHPAFLSANTVLLYAAMPHEADPRLLAEYATTMGKSVAYPYCVNATQMVAMQPLEANDLEPGAYGILAPVPERSKIIPPEEVDFVLVPGLAFDTRGGRLGRGAGFYDRYLLLTRAFRAGFCFEQQLVRELPMEEHDLFMHAIFTEAGYYPTMSMQ